MTTALQLVTEPEDGRELIYDRSGQVIGWWVYPLPERFWIEYARLSKQPDGQQLNTMDSVEKQREKNIEHAEDEGLPVGLVLYDNGRSGWDEAVEREAFNLAMSIAAKDARVIGFLSYTYARLSRNDADTAAIIRLGRLMKRDGRKFYLDGDGLDRVTLHRAKGWASVRQLSAKAVGGSDESSESIEDELAKRARAGLQLGGGRLYGFEVLRRVREHEDDVNPRQRPAEAKIIREVAERVTADKPETWKTVAADLNRRAAEVADDETRRKGPLTTVRGGPWEGQNLARMVGAARNGGVVMLRGREVGFNEPCPADCASKHGHVEEPILDAELYARVQGLRAGARRGRRPTGRYLSKVVWCGNPKCEQAAKGLTMSGRMIVGKVRAYQCARSNGGCDMTVNAGPTEEKIRARVLDYAGDPDTIDRINAGEHDRAGERAAAESKVARLRGLLADLDEQHARRLVDGVPDDGYERQRQVFTRAIIEAEQALRAVRPATGRARVITAQKYDALTQVERSSLIIELGLRVTVVPPLADRPGGKFDPRRVEITEP